MYEQSNCDLSATNSSDSGAKSRRSCWVSNENNITPNFELNSATTTIKTPKKVNFQSLDEVSWHKEFSSHQLGAKEIIADSSH